MARIAVVHQRIANNTTPIDVAFIGTSHTWNSIADQELQRQLATLGADVSVANIGSSWMGRDLHLFLLKQLLEYKRPRLVVIEITDHEFAFGHEALPYVGNLSDLMCCRPYLDPEFPGHFALYLKNQVVAAVELLRRAETPQAAKSGKDFGWMAVDKVWKTPVPNSQPRTLKQRLKYKAYAWTGLYGLSAVEQMVGLAKEKGVKVAFLYLPVYEHALIDPANDLENFVKLGPVIKLPARIGRDPSLWFDDSHLNRTGAMMLTTAIAPDIRAQLDSKNFEGPQSSPVREPQQIGGSK
jgi:hypothetical protein